jgi:hypothetical protein
MHISAPGTPTARSSRTTVKEYWRRVRSQVWKDTFAVFGLTSGQRVVIRALVFIGSVALALYFAPKDTESRALYAFATIALYFTAFFGIWLWNFIRTPAVFDDQANKRIQELNGQLEQRPKLRLRFDRSNPDCICPYHPQTGRGKHVHLFAQVDATFAVECRVELKIANENCEYKPAPGYHRTAHHLAWAHITTWSDKIKPATLSPGVPYLLDVLSTFHGEHPGIDAFRLWIDPGHVYNLIWFSQPGTYRLLIRMTAAVPSVPDELTLYVIWDGDPDKLDVVDTDPCAAKRAGRNF